MDGEALVERLEERKATELKRLGSEKALLAATNADLEPGTVLGVLAREHAAARDTYRSWATDEGSDRAREAFESAAEAEADRIDRLGTDPDTAPDPRSDPADPADPVHVALRDVEGTAERVAAGLVARPLVADRTLLQGVNFFVNEADRERADAVRSIRSEVGELPGEGAALLDAVAATDEEYERALSAAEAVVDTAYEAYASALESMGLDPRPVC